VARKKRQVEAEYEGLEKGTEVGRDVLSLMIRANMAPDLLPNQRLSDQEVIDQITTLVSLTLLAYADSADVCCNRDHFVCTLFRPLASEPEPGCPEQAP
jgi:hypothetical protein